MLAITVARDSHPKLVCVKPPNKIVSVLFMFRLFNDKHLYCVKYPISNIKFIWREKRRAV